MAENAYRLPETKPARRLKSAPAGLVLIVILSLTLGQLGGDVRSARSWADGQTASAQTGSNPDSGWTREKADRIWGLMRMWAAAKRSFVFFDRVPGLDWDAAVREAILPAARAGSWDDYYRLLNGLAARLNDGHTLVIPPWAFNGQNDQPPIELQMVEGKVLLARAADTEACRSQHLVPGMELTAVEGRPVRAYLRERVFSIFSGGTKQRQESYGLFLLLDGPTGTPVRLTFLDRNRRAVDAVLSRNGRKVGFVHRIYDLAPLVKADMLKDEILYVKLASFQSDQIEPDFLKALEKFGIGRIKGLILDVRYNAGGNSANGWKIVSHLIDKPIPAVRWKTRSYRPADEAWGRPESWLEADFGRIEPAKEKTYAGPVAVLIGPQTFSAAEDFLVPLDFSGRAVLIGERTAGSTGQPLHVPLPGGGAFWVCAVRTMYPDGKEFVGLGIPPHVEAAPTQQDVYGHRDRALEKALAALKSARRH